MVPSGLAGGIIGSAIGGVDVADGSAGAMVPSAGAMVEVSWVAPIAGTDGSIISSSAGWQAANPAAPSRTQVIIISRIVQLSRGTFAATIHSGSPTPDNPTRPPMLRTWGARDAGLPERSVGPGFGTVAPRAPAAGKRLKPDKFSPVGSTVTLDRFDFMDADRKQQILSAEARAELISTLVGKGFYIYGPEEVERWHRARGGAPDPRSTALASKPGTLGRTDPDKPDRADIPPTNG